MLAFLPGLISRLHHYIVVMMLFSDIAFPTRLFAIHQAFLWQLQSQI